MLDLGVRWLAPAVGALLWGVSAASAQEVRLQALDDGSGAAVADVEIAFVDAGGGLVWRGITDVAGSVVAELDEPGVYRIRASHPGFQPWESEALGFEEGAVVALELRLGLRAIPLEPLIVVGRRSPEAVHVEEFERRRTDPAGSGGVFLTRADIERRPLASASQIVEGIAGVTVQPVLTSAAPFGELDRGLIVLPGGRGGRGCLANVWVDGMQVRQGPEFTVDDLLESDNLAGVEVYRRALSAPPAYQTDPDCGVVLFWTRRPDDGGSWSVTRIAAGAAAVLGLLLFGFTR